MSSVAYGRRPALEGRAALAVFSERSRLREPDALEVEVGLVGQDVVVAVVVQDREPVTVGERGDEQVDGRQAMVTNPSQLALGIE